MSSERPFIFINCAMSADGKIALPSGRQLKISGEEDFARVHRLRNSSDAVVVGIKTILSDDPKLTVKEKFVCQPRQPLRVVLDSRLQTPLDAQVLNPGAQTLIATSEEGIRNEPGKMAELVKLNKDREHRIMVFAFGRKLVELPRLVHYLRGQGRLRIFVEGGGTVMTSFLREGLVDEYSVFVGSLIVAGQKTPVPFMGEGFQEPGEVPRLRLKNVERLDDGVLLRYDVL